MPSRAERYLAHLDRLSDDIEPTFTRVESTKPELKSVTVMIYKDHPEPGYLTALTYGLSLAEHPDWRSGSPELCISVRSTDTAWAPAAGLVAEGLRGRCPFTYGGTINFGAPISPESAMTSFLVFAPAVLDKEDYSGIDVSPPGHEGHDIINIAGRYPIHDSERR
jgi:hypothetical protein